MEDILNISEWADDASSKTVEIYSAFIKKAILEDEDRQKLKKERGFTDAIIDLCNFKSCRKENRELVYELQDQFGEDALLEAGLLEAKEDGIKVCSQLIGVYKDNKFVNNICIPYFNQDGEIFYIRPHKYGLKEKGINLYVPSRKTDPDRIWIITESEFKAAAALQLGFPAIGLPGIHSFAVNNFTRLQDFIQEMGIDKMVIIFDNEIKDNPSFKNYKPNVLKQWDTQWRSIDMCRKLLKSGAGSVKIGVLPASWMVEGKIDIDGALAQGHTTTEFKAIIYNAMEWSTYLETVPSIGKKIIRKKIYREDYLATCNVKKTDSEYIITRKKVKARDTEIATVEDHVSNFVMDIRKTLIEGGVYIREVTVRGVDGSISKPHLTKQGTNLLRDFKSWVWGCGNYTFSGSQEDLDLIWQLEGALADGREVHRPEQIGYIHGADGNFWLFSNVLIRDTDGAHLLPDEDGIIWNGLTGYMPRSIKEDLGNTNSNGKVPTINLDEKIPFGINELKDAVDKIEEIFETKSIRLAVGWVIACLLSEEIFKNYACFPLLFIGGKREAGKSTLGNWLMAMAGQADIAGDSLSNTSQPGAERNLAWYGSLPYWLDEYRNDPKIKKWEGFFRNAYQRQANAKGTLGTNIRSHDINAGIIISGEETPQDNAFLSRCVLIPLTSRKNRKGSSEYSDQLFKDLESLRIKGLLSRLMLEVIKVRKKILPSIINDIEGWKKRIVESVTKGVADKSEKAQKMGDRTAINYAIPAVCYDAVFLKNASIAEREEFRKWVIEESHKVEAEKESEHMLSLFMEEAVTLCCGEKDQLQGFYSVYEASSEELANKNKGKKRIALHFPTFYSKWAESFKRKGGDAFKRGTILDYIRDEPYFIQDNFPKRIGGKVIRALILSLDDKDEPPAALLTIAGEGGTPQSPIVPKSSSTTLSLDSDFTAIDDFDPPM